MPIQIASQLIPRNGNTWPIAEDVHIKGGYRVLSTLVDRDAVDVLTLKVGTKVYVVENQTEYRVTSLDPVTWAEETSGGISDAPSDGKTYERKDGSWVESGGGLSPGDVLTTVRTLAAPGWLKCDGAVYPRSSYPDVEALLPSPPPDGITWTQRTLPASANWQAVVYGNEVFVAMVSNSNVAATSTDGITWTERTLPASTNWVSVTYGNGMFVAVASNSNIAATSPNGITWTQRTLPASVNWYSVTYGNGTFVAVTYGNDVAATSPDGITWTQRTLPANTSWYSVTYGNGTFVAVTYGNVAATSPDGITWTLRMMPVATYWQSITYGNGVFVAVARNNSIAATNSGDLTKFQVPLINNPAPCISYIKATA